MLDEPTILAALIGALIGSLGGKLVEHYLGRKSENVRKQEMLVQQYLYQLQDSVESLWFRLNNIAFQDGLSQMEEPYFKVTTMYALGSVLASERIMALDGIYPQLPWSLRRFLRKNRLDEKLEGGKFHKYYRISLAETSTELIDDRFRTSTFLEFQKRYNEEPEDSEWIQKANDVIEDLGNDVQKTGEMLNQLNEIAEQLAKSTKISKAEKIQK